MNLRATIQLLLLFLLFAQNKGLNVKDVGAVMDKMIKSKAVVVIAKSNCPKSKEAKKALAEHNIDPMKSDIMDIDLSKTQQAEASRKEIEAYMKKLTGASDVPWVFIGGRFIGGAEETVAAHKNGDLKKMLMEAGALLEEQD